MLDTRRRVPVLKTLTNNTDWRKIDRKRDKFATRSLPRLKHSDFKFSGTLALQKVSVEALLTLR